MVTGPRLFSSRECCRPVHPELQDFAKPFNFGARAPCQHGMPAVARETLAPEWQWIQRGRNTGCHRPTWLRIMSLRALRSMLVGLILYHARHDRRCQLPDCKPLVLRLPSASGNRWGNIDAPATKAFGIHWTKEYETPIGRPIKIPNSLNDERRGTVRSCCKPVSRCGSAPPALRPDRLRAPAPAGSPGSHRSHAASAA